MKYITSYQQHVVMECAYTLDVPADVVAQGEEAIKEYCIDHELDAQEISTNPVDWQDHVPGSHEVEAV